MTKAKEMSDAEVVAALNDKSLLSEIRRMIYFGVARAEQAAGQRRPLGVIEIRRRELELAERIIDKVKTSEVTSETVKETDNAAS